MEDKLLLDLLQSHARMEVTDLAAALDASQDDVLKRMSELEKQKVICGYKRKSRKRIWI